MSTLLFLWHPLLVGSLAADWGAIASKDHDSTRMEGVRITQRQDTKMRPVVVEPRALADSMKHSILACAKR